MGQRRPKRVLGQRLDEEEADDNAEEEEESGGVVAEMGNLSIDTAGTEQEAAKNLQEAL